MAKLVLDTNCLIQSIPQGVVTMSCGNPLWTERTSSVYPMKYWRNI